MCTLLRSRRACGRRSVHTSVPALLHVHAPVVSARAGEQERAHVSRPCRDVHAPAVSARVSRSSVHMSVPALLHVHAPAVWARGAEQEGAHGRPGPRRTPQGAHARRASAARTRRATLRTVTGEVGLRDAHDDPAGRFEQLVAEDVRRPALRVEVSFALVLDRDLELGVAEVGVQLDAVDDDERMHHGLRQAGEHDAAARDRLEAGVHADSGVLGRGSQRGGSPQTGAPSDEVGEPRRSRVRPPRQLQVRVATGAREQGVDDVHEVLVLQVPRQDEGGGDRGEHAQSAMLGEGERRRIDRDVPGAARPAAGRAVRPRDDEGLVRGPVGRQREAPQPRGRDAAERVVRGHPGRVRGRDVDESLDGRRPHAAEGRDEVAAAHPRRRHAGAQRVADEERSAGERLGQGRWCWHAGTVPARGPTLRRRIAWLWTAVMPRHAVRHVPCPRSALRVHAAALHLPRGPQQRAPP